MKTASKPASVYGGIAALAVGAAVTVAPAQSVTLEERDWLLGSYELGQGSWGIAGTANAFLQSLDGFPGAWLRVQVNVAGGTPPPAFSVGSSSVALVLLRNRAISPASIGGILTLDASASHRFVSANVGGCNCSGQSLLLRQAGALYSAPMPNAGGAWNDAVLQNLTAQSFTRVLFQSPAYFDPDQHPDFSASGAPIEVGISRGNSNGPTEPYIGYTVETGLDNLIVTARGCIAALSLPQGALVCPTSEHTFTASGIGAFQIAYRWQVADTAVPGGWRDLVDGPNALPASAPPGTFAASGVDTLSVTVRDFYSGASFPTLEVPVVLRCALTNTCGAAFTETITLSLCRADFNCDGNLDPDDLADYINCYFAPVPCDGADFNADGDNNPDDLGDYINAYFGGCG